MDEFILTPKEVKNQIKKTRHNAELVLYFMLSIFGLVVLQSYLSMGSGSSEAIDEIMNILLQTADEPDSVMISVIAGIIKLLFFNGIVALVFVVLRTIVEMYRYYAGQMAYSIRVSEHNFPEIYEKVKEYTRLLELDKEPEVYVRQMNGSLNAYTSWVFGKPFIQLNAEIVDLAYMENKDFDTVLFVLAHEFGHVYLHHVHLHYNLLPILANMVPGLGIILYMMLSRAREYSCDRVAQALTNDKNHVECMMLLGVGRHAYRHIDVENYLQEINTNHNKVELMFRWFTNFFSTHPIMPFRTKAILDPEKNSGRLV